MFHLILPITTTNPPRLVIPTGAASLFPGSRSEHWPRSGGIPLRFIAQVACVL